MRNPFQCPLPDTVDLRVFIGPAICCNHLAGGVVHIFFLYLLLWSQMSSTGPKSSICTMGCHPSLHLLCCGRPVLIVVLLGPRSSMPSQALNPGAHRLCPHHTGGPRTWARQPEPHSWGSRIQHPLCNTNTEIFKKFWKKYSAFVVFSEINIFAWIHWNIRNHSMLSCFQSFIWRGRHLLAVKTPVSHIRTHGGSTRL